MVNIVYYIDTNNDLFKVVIMIFILIIEIVLFVVAIPVGVLVVNTEAMFPCIAITITLGILILRNPIVRIRMHSKSSKKAS